MSSVYLKIALLLSIAFEHHFIAASPAPPSTITAAPNIEKRAVDPAFIGWSTVAGTWSPFWCNQGYTYATSNNFVRCCPLSGPCTYATTCSNDVLYGGGTSASCGVYSGTNLNCVTGLIYQSPGDTNPVTNYDCVVYDWTAYRSLSSGATTTPISRTTPTEHSISVSTSGLAGGISAVTVTISPTTGSVTSTGSNLSTITSSGSSNNNSSSPNTGAIVGGVVGGVAGLAIICAGLFFWRKKSEPKPITLAPTEPPMTQTVMSPGQPPYGHQSWGGATLVPGSPPPPSGSTPPQEYFKPTVYSGQLQGQQLQQGAMELPANPASRPHDVVELPAGH